MKNKGSLWTFARDHSYELLSTNFRFQLISWKAGCLALGEYISSDKTTQLTVSNQPDGRLINLASEYPASPWGTFLGSIIDIDVTWEKGGQSDNPKVHAQMIKTSSNGTNTFKYSETLFDLSLPPSDARLDLRSIEQAIRIAQTIQEEEPTPIPYFN